MLSPNLHIVPGELVVHHHKIIELQLDHLAWLELMQVQLTTNLATCPQHHGPHQSHCVPKQWSMDGIANFSNMPQM